MKRTIIFGLLAALMAFLLALGTLADAAPLAKKTKTPTTEATQEKTRKPKKTKTPKPKPTAEATPDAAAIDPETAAEESAAELSPIAPGPMTSQILLFNPDTSGAATVQIDIYNASGGVAYTTNVNISKNGAKVVTLPGSLGPNFQGGAMVSSDKNVQAIVVGSNANKTARDAYEGANSPATNVTLPFVRHLAQDTQNTLLAVQNTTGNSANVTVTFYNLDGSTATSQNANLAAHQSFYLNTNSLFPSGTFVGSARVVSNQSVAVAAETLYYKDTAAFVGTTAADQDTTLFLSEAFRKINGAGVSVNWSEIFVRNNGGNATNVTLELYDPTGAPIGSQTANGIPGNGTAQFLLNDTAFAGLGNNFTGWGKISSSGEPVAATVLSVLNKGKRMYSLDALANAQLKSKYFCGSALRTSTENSRISILNTDAAVSAPAKVILYHPDTGKKLAVYKLTVAPNSTSTVLLSDAAFAAAGTIYQGMAIVSAGGSSPPKLVVTVNNPYGSSKLSGTTGYSCTAIQ